MDEHTCPWWFGYTFDNPVRRILHDPREVLGELVSQGDVVADLGCGGGHFSLGMARLVGGEGRVIAVDLQEKMLERTRRRAKAQGLEDRMEFRRCEPDDLGLDKPLDFALAFWMVHEVGDPAAFFHQVRSVLNPPGHLMVAEPKVHVTAASFAEEVTVAGESGFEVVAEPTVRFSRAVVLSPASSGASD